MCGRGKSPPRTWQGQVSGAPARPGCSVRCAILWENVAETQRCPTRRVDEPVGRSGLSGPRWADLAQKRWESADKPGSVEDNHPSGTHVTVRLERPTRKPLRAAGTDPKARALPYLVLLQVGFAVPPNVATGAVRSYRTVSPLPAPLLLQRLGGLLSVALSVGSRPPGITWHLALWSPDFPPRREAQRLPGRLPRAV